MLHSFPANYEEKGPEVEKDREDNRQHEITVVYLRNYGDNNATHDNDADNNNENNNYSYYYNINRKNLSSII